MTHKTGDVFNAEVEVLKVKKGKPTVIRVNDEEYVLRHKNQYQGGK